MKKGICVALLTMFLMISLVGCNSDTNETTIETTTEATTETTVETTTATIPETTIDYTSLSNEEFTNQIAEDFSTADVSFSVRSVSDTIAFLDTSGSDDINIYIGFSDYGDHITMSFVTDRSEDECYFVLLQALQSKIFNISEEDQIDILAHYLIDEIDYSQENIKITETIKDNIVVIGFWFQ